MFNGIYPVKIHTYQGAAKQGHKKAQEVDSEEQNQQSATKHSAQEQLQEQTKTVSTPNFNTNYNFNNQLYKNAILNSQRTGLNIHNAQAKKSLNIHQIITDFKNTQIAISTPQDILDQTKPYLETISEESLKDKPSASLIQSNFLSASKILDKYIGETLNKESHVVEGWIKAIFLQEIDYKADPEAVNEAFKLKFPKGTKLEETDRNVNENLDILYPESVSLNLIEKNVDPNGHLAPIDDKIIAPEETAESTPSSQAPSIKFAQLTTSNANFSSVEPEKLNEPILEENLTKTDLENESYLSEQTEISQKDAALSENFQVHFPHIETLSEQETIAQTEPDRLHPQKPYVPEDENLKNLFVEAKHLTRKEESQEALNVLELALARAQEIGDYKFIPYIMFEAGKIYAHNNQTADSLQFFENAIENSTNDYLIKALAHCQIGKIYDKNARLENSCDHYFASVSFAAQCENLKLQTQSLTKISEIFASQYNKNDALDFATLAKDISIETEDALLIGKTHSKSAKIAFGFDEKRITLDDLKISTKNLLEAENFENAIENYIMASEVMLQLNNPQKALTLLEKAYKSAYLNSSDLISKVEDKIENLKRNHFA